MTDATDEMNETDQPVLPTIAADSYRGVADLIALMVDPKAFAAKLRSLQQREAAAARAEAQLASARVAHDEYIAKTSAELKEQMSALAKRRTDIEAREARLQAAQDILARHKEILDARRYRKLGGNGLTQDLGEPSLPSADPHFPEPQSDDPWFAPTAANTITRTTTRKSV
jgi:hypothetical protein